MRLLDTLSGEKREIPRGKRVNFFVCGPTVFDYSHIGHARTYLAFDMLVRYLRAKGARVFYLQNVTDIDDKIIDRAREKKRRALELATAFYREYRRDMRTLNIK
ncbi:MAG: class I tRNA ligase family protein, partial [Patescibacteria group bacterium]